MTARPLKRDLTNTERLHAHVRKALVVAPDFIVKEALLEADRVYQDGAGWMNGALEAARALAEDLLPFVPTERIAA